MSHIYADRMCSCLLGWSRIGADKMSRLRIYERNGGDMLNLVRFQKKDLLAVSGCEELICSSKQMFLSENKNRDYFGALADIPVYSIPYT